MASHFACVIYHTYTQRETQNAMRSLPTFGPHLTTARSTLLSPEVLFVISTAVDNSKSLLLQLPQLIT